MRAVGSALITFSESLGLLGPVLVGMTVRASLDDWLVPWQILAALVVVALSGPWRVLFRTRGKVLRRRSEGPQDVQLRITGSAQEPYRAVEWASAVGVLSALDVPVPLAVAFALVGLVCQIGMARSTAALWAYEPVFGIFFRVWTGMVRGRRVVIVSRDASLGPGLTTTKRVADEVYRGGTRRFHAR